MRMTEQERRIRIRHLKRMYRIRERKERHAVLVIRKHIITTIAKEHKELSSMQMALHEKRV